MEVIVMKPMKLEKTTIKIGIEKPFKLLHITDTHLCMADERDDLRKQELAINRAKAFEVDTPGCCMEYFKQSCAFAREQGALLVHTGDLFDFVSVHTITAWHYSIFCKLSKQFDKTFCILLLCCGC